MGWYPAAPTRGNQSGALITGSSPMSSLLRARQLARRCEPRPCQGYRRAEIGVVGPNIDDVPARDLDRLSIAMEEIAGCKRDGACERRLCGP